MNVIACRFGDVEADCLADDEGDCFSLEFPRVA
jgi:hypothetical protein